MLSDPSAAFLELFLGLGSDSHRKHRVAPNLKRMTKQRSTIGFLPFAYEYVLCPLLVLKGLYHYWYLFSCFQGIHKMEVLGPGFLFLCQPSSRPDLDIGRAVCLLRFAGLSFANGVEMLKMLDQRWGWDW